MGQLSIFSLALLGALIIAQCRGQKRPLIRDPDLSEESRNSRASTMLPLVNLEGLVGLPRYLMIHEHDENRAPYRGLGRSWQNIENYFGRHGNPQRQTYLRSRSVNYESQLRQPSNAQAQTIQAPVNFQRQPETVPAHTSLAPVNLQRQPEIMPTQTSQGSHNYPIRQFSRARRQEQAVASDELSPRQNISPEESSEGWRDYVVEPQQKKQRGWGD